MTNHYTGNVIIVAAPSGGGKTSLVKHVITTLSNIEVSISHTTRQMRPGEINGFDYFFINNQQFQNMIDNKQFIEYAQVFNHFYGTSVEQIKKRLTAGIDVILDIDWQGAQQIKSIFADAISIFIIPPSLNTLKERLQNRKQDNEQVIRQRMQQAQDELGHYAEFDYLIVNDSFAAAASELQAIIIANRLHASKQCIKLKELLSLLLSNR